jgi:hypothetical protein
MPHLQTVQTVHTHIYTEPREEPYHPMHHNDD